MSKKKVVCLVEMDYDDDTQGKVVLLVTMDRSLPTVILEMLAASVIGACEDSGADIESIIARLNRAERRAAKQVPEMPSIIGRG